MVAAVAMDEPHTAPKAAQEPTADMARPPRQWPIIAAAARNSPLASPPREANWPISRNSGITDRS
ncbi:hypothetical protein D3C85_1221540 [compost metagenome]